MQLKFVVVMKELKKDDQKGLVKVPHASGMETTLKMFVQEAYKELPRNEEWDQYHSLRILYAPQQRWAWRGWNRICYRA